MKKKATILILDDDDDVLITAKMILRAHYQKIITENSPKSLESLLKKEPIDIIILDMNFKVGATSGNEGLFWLRKIKELTPATLVIMNTAYGDIQLAVECMKEGATDFLVKPWEKEKLLATVNTVYQLALSEKKIERLTETKTVLHQDLSDQMGEMIGSSEAMKKVYDAIKKVAATDANVLILGENGTGKELVARAIHQLSKRKSEAFLKVDLGAISDNLFESELFGHTKGAFTDAKTDKPGRFEIADQGSLFLDEIGNISLAHQAKLLSVLQNRQITRVGANKSTAIDIRLISATNKNINEMVDQEQFREDLVYRINTIEISLPPLRERKGDIPLLINHFIKKYGSKYDKKSLSVNDEVMSKLSQYPWPGNVRELQHAVERAVIMSAAGTLTEDDFLTKKTVNFNVSEASLNVGDVEKQTIMQALEKSGGNLTKAAKTLGLGRSTLYRKMNKYGL
ncbi:sigma-54 dependent transcriptional regulator [Fulvivirga maritima]|uniref:sigma-54-dependent transcriptional regulator n=1 Tax=Fulvivirga maritima TaxID=2904247 RepID=UPI001F455CFA|nr:sigma-54 dependent transcriptional regulator [Fulvivirga maritima]UII26093.1 sigma-54 dependent transcriptional regulator [Fulvivirga maritima]